jgi:serine/threonine protein kinase
VAREGALNASEAHRALRSQAIEYLEIETRDIRIASVAHEMDRLKQIGSGGRRKQERISGSASRQNARAAHFTRSTKIGPTLREFVAKIFHQVNRWNRDRTILQNIKLDKTAFQPQFLSNSTQAQPSDQHYIKHPNLLSYRPITDANKTCIINEVLQEVQVCEVLRLQPHSNIAEYIGCGVHDGRISRICFKQYKQSLQQRLNPGHLNKREFARSVRLDEGWCEGIIEGIRKGLEYLHTLGFVHNDLTPANVMLEERDMAIIIDFRSCRAMGESLKGAGRTYEWYDDEVKTASESNDLDALAEMEAWMLGKVVDFKFAEMSG